MKASTKSLLAETFAEYEKLVAVGAISSAITALGKALRLTPPSSKARDDFMRELRVRVQPKHLSDAAIAAAVSWRRAMHIMSIGTTFNDDEILLLFTLRQEVELVSDVLKIFGVDANDLALTRIDDELREIANSKSEPTCFRQGFQSSEKELRDPGGKSLERVTVLIPCTAA